MKKKKLLVITCILALTVCSIAAFGGSSTEPKAKTSSAQTTQVTQNNESKATYTTVSSSWKSAYLSIVRKKASKIEAYDPVNDKRTPKPAALYDINKDGVPELFLMYVTAQDYDCQTSIMRIYTCKNGTAKELRYKFHTRYSNMLKDFDAGAGTTYVVYKGKKKNQFYIFSGTVSGDSVDYFVTKYALTNGRIKTLKRLHNLYSYTDTSYDRYWINGKRVAHSTGGAAFTAAFKDVSRALLYSGDDTSVSLWKNFDKSKAACMTYNQLLVRLGGSKTF